MKPKAILMRCELARQSLAGQKSVTRRAVKFPIKNRSFGCEIAGCELRHELELDPGLCPYGEPGQLLYVKETHWRLGHWVKNGISDTGRQKHRFVPWPKIEGVTFDEPAEHLRGASRDNLTDRYWKRPSLFMPREASRLTLLVKNVSVVRLKDITEQEVISEGGTMRRIGSGDVRTGMRDCWSIGGYEAENADQAFELLWESINGPGSWDENPYLWRIEYEAIAKNVEEVLRERG